MTLWMVACQAPLSMGSPRQEYWSDLPDSGIKLIFPANAISSEINTEKLLLHSKAPVP